MAPIFYWNIFNKKNFIVWYRPPPPIDGVDGGKVYVDALLYVESLHPNFVEKSGYKLILIIETLSNSLIILNKNDYYCPLKN